MMDEEELFQKFQPKLTEVTAIQTMEFFTKNGPIVSANGKEIGIGDFLLVMTTGVETYGPFPLNGTTAAALCNILIESGFGPEEEPVPAGEIG